MILPPSSRHDFSTRTQLHFDDGGYRSLRTLDSQTKNALVAAQKDRPTQTLWMFGAALVFAVVATAVSRIL